MINTQKIGLIDLASGSIREQEVSAEMRRLFLGGRGINMYLLYTHTTAHLDPLSPDNPVIIGAGLLAGTSAPTAARCSISGKSPETGLLGDSNIGGYFAAHLRRTGFDHLIITGQAPEPVYVAIEEGRIHLREASDLWGKDTLEALDLIRGTHGPASQSLIIGPAGENLVRFAAVRHGLKNTAARTGLGCLMGSKRLKAVVVKGKGPLSLHRPEEMAAYTAELRRRLRGTRTSEVLHRYGTPFLYDLHNARGILRTRNAQASQFKEGRELRAGNLRKYYTKASGCYACPIRCTHSYRYPGRDRGDLTGTGLEYGVIGALGPICGVERLECLLKVSDLLNRLGLDASTTGNLIAWVMELSQRGLINPKDTGGLSLSWGNEETIMALVRQIAAREGLGAILADGAWEAAKRLGPESERYLIWSKRLPQSDSVDLRALRGFALGVATASRGADHLRSRPTLEAIELTPEALHQVYGREVSTDPTSYEGKAYMVWWSEIQYALGDALGLCRFAQKFNSSEHLGLEEFARLIFLATGIKFSTDKLIQVGERIVTLERLFLEREGVDRSWDTLPERYFEEAMESGQFKGEKIDRKAFNRMQNEYYHLHGWEVVTGNPRPESLHDLGLDRVLQGEALL
ncbi:MAG: aldehyde ferredoxin oxidoreductase family protein [Thermodesulfobacteriota bacterium]